MLSSPPRELGSWKEIADYLGVVERTAQKWEAERGLPIRRLPGPKGRVSADPGDLDRWKDATLQRPARRGGVFLKAYAVAATVLLVVLGSLQLRETLAEWRRGPPARFRLANDTLVVTDPDGREIWRHAFPDRLVGPRYSPEALGALTTAWMGDLDGDARVETLFAYQPGDGGGAAALIAFSERGMEQWRFVPGDRTRDGRPMPARALVNDFTVIDMDRDGRMEVVLSVFHVPQALTQVAVVDAGGTLRAEYWHPGRFSQLDTQDVDADGVPEVLLAGASERYGAALLVVLDTQGLLEARPQPAIPPDGSAVYSRVERELVLFPRTCVNEALDVTNRVAFLAFDNGGIQVRVNERPRGADAAIIYDLDLAMNVLAVHVTDSLQIAHRELRATGRLDHDLTDPEIAALAEGIRVLETASVASTSAP
ncbi:MAG: hypothetical protein HY657_18140 [Acidobacteria bacterium]|nr:hypothetical protein [Acidobacteriota bacterium]